MTLSLSPPRAQSGIGLGPTGEAPPRIILNRVRPLIVVHKTRGHLSDSTTKAPPSTREEAELLPHNYSPPQCRVLTRVCTSYARPVK